jgi:hypothetical protein
VRGTLLPRWGITNGRGALQIATSHDSRIHIVTQDFDTSSRQNPSNIYLVQSYGGWQQDGRYGRTIRSDIEAPEPIEAPAQEEEDCYLMYGVSSSQAKGTETESLVRSVC